GLGGEDRGGHGRADPGGRRRGAVLVKPLYEPIHGGGKFRPLSPYCRSESAKLLLQRQVHVAHAPEGIVQGLHAAGFPAGLDRDCDQCPRIVNDSNQLRKYRFAIEAIAACYASLQAYRRYNSCRESDDRLSGSLRLLLRRHLQQSRTISPRYLCISQTSSVSSKQACDILAGDYRFQSHSAFPFGECLVNSQYHCDLPPGTLQQRRPRTCLMA